MGRRTFMLEANVTAFPGEQVSAARAATLPWRADEFAVLFEDRVSARGLPRQGQSGLARECVSRAWRLIAAPGHPLGSHG